MRHKAVHQHGGVKLRDPGKTGFLPIYEMLQSPGARLRVISTSSLFGVVLGLTVQRDHAQYDELTRGAFSRPVTDYVLKVVVISESKSRQIIPYKPSLSKSLDENERRKNEKKFETAQSFYREAQIQQYVWSHSVVGGKGKICPPIANFSLLDKPGSQAFLIDVSRFNADEEIISFIDYFTRCLGMSEVSGLGIITMPTIQNGVTFGEFTSARNAHLMRIMFKQSAITQKVKNEALMCIFVKVVWLLLKMNLYHEDLHQSNSMVYLNTKNEINCLIIDFGKVVDFTNQVGEGKFNYEIKSYLLGFIAKVNSKIQKDITLEEKLHILENIFLMLADCTKGVLPEGERGQMQWLLDGFQKMDESEKIKAFDMIKSLLADQLPEREPTRETMRTLFREGSLTNLSPQREPSAMFAPYPNSRLPPSSFDAFSATSAARPSYPPITSAPMIVQSLTGKVPSTIQQQRRQSQKPKSAESLTSFTEYEERLRGVKRNREDSEQSKQNKRGGATKCHRKGKCKRTKKNLMKRRNYRTAKTH